MQQARNMERVTESRRSVDEIVADIVVELGGAQGKTLKEPKDIVYGFTGTHGKPRNKSEVARAVRHEITVLVRRLTMLDRKRGEIRGWRRAQADRAQSIDNLLARLERELEDPFAPTPPPGFMPVIKPAIERYREACRVQMRVQPKAGRSADNVKQDCARSAYSLMQWFSKRTITGSARGAFSSISTLLHEAVIGEYASCKRACDRVLRDKRRH